jgi:hypothetical protein
VTREPLDSWAVSLLQRWRGAGTAPYLANLHAETGHFLGEVTERGQVGTPDAGTRGTAGLDATRPHDRVADDLAGPIYYALMEQVGFRVPRHTSAGAFAKSVATAVAIRLTAARSAAGEAPEHDINCGIDPLRLGEDIGCTCWVAAGEAPEASDE